jgi:hypothetical protein
MIGGEMSLIMSDLPFRDSSTIHRSLGTSSVIRHRRAQTGQVLSGLLSFGQAEAVGGDGVA